MKKTSLGRQHFERVLEDGCIYVDKTRLIHQLATQFQQVFLSRPRRFGKSLLLSTLANLFSAKSDVHALSFDGDFQPFGGRARRP